MAAKKIIAVIGARGAQGGGLVRAIQADPNGGFVARAITRKPESDEAKALAAAGIEVVRADTDDASTLEPAFAGVHGVFCMTNFWEHFSAEREIVQAGNMARAAKAAGAEHVIWSTLDDTRKKVPLDDDRMPTLHGRYKVPHFDGKGEADRQFGDAGVPTTWMLTVFFWDNLVHFGMGPKRGPDGKLAITFPMDDAKLPGIAAADVGKCAYGIFRRGPELIGERVGIAGGQPTCAEMAATLSRVLGQEVRYNAVTPEAYRGFGFPGAEDLGNMFQFKRDFNDEYCASRSVDFSRSVNPDPLGFEAWAQKNSDRIPLD